MAPSRRASVNSELSERKLAPCMPSSRTVLSSLGGKCRSQQERSSEWNQVNSAPEQKRRPLYCACADHEPTTDRNTKLYRMEKCCPTIQKSRKGEKKKEGTINSRDFRKFSQRGNIVTGWAEFCKTIELIFGVITWETLLFPLLPGLNFVTNPLREHSSFLTIQVKKVKYRKVN